MSKQILISTGKDNYIAVSGETLAALAEGAMFSKNYNDDFTPLKQFKLDVALVETSDEALVSKIVSLEKQLQDSQLEVYKLNKQLELS